MTRSGIRTLWLALWVLAACQPTYPAVRLTEDWPPEPRSYDAVVDAWTRKAQLHADYQEVCELTATFKSAE